MLSSRISGFSSAGAAAVFVHLGRALRGSGTGGVSVVGETLATSTGFAASVTIRISPNTVPAISSANTLSLNVNAASGTVYQITATNPVVTSYAVVPPSVMPPGLLLNTSTGAYNYVPALNYNGSDSFTYTFVGAGGLTATATVTLSITGLTHVYANGTRALDGVVDDALAQGGNVTIAITTDTLRWGSSTGSRTLAANGTATALKVASTTWRLTGDGIT